MAECFKIYSENLIDNATITSSTTNALFPVSNLKDYRRSKVYRSTGSTAEIVFDFQETSSIDGIFIVSDKRAGFGVSTVVVEFNATDEWTSPAKTIAVPFSERFELGHVTFPEINYRFARVLLTSSLAYCELSKIYIGSEIKLKQGISFGWSILDEELSNRQYNRYGQLFTDVILRQKMISCSFKMIPKEDMDNLFILMDRVGNSKPVYIAIGENNITEDYRRFSGMVFLEDIPTVVNSIFARYDLSIAFKEAT